jgi:sister-chromatid-cohesion protein PDS5
VGGGFPRNSETAVETRPLFDRNAATHIGRPIRNILRPNTDKRPSIHLSLREFSVMAPTRSRRRAQPTEPSPEPEADQVETEEEAEEEEDAEEEQDQDEQLEEGTGETVKLKFNEEISWRPGKPIPASRLIERLGKLTKELEELDQETVDQDSLKDVAQALGSKNLIGHKDAGVRARTASCLVDILRLCAPDAPFSEDELQVSSSLARSMDGNVLTTAG